MRLGTWDCEISEGSLAYKIYGQKKISERHRHRYEFNNDYSKQLRSKGMLASGINSKTGLVEIIEITNHPWFVGVQYHPEYKSTVEKPHPLFIGFINAVIKEYKVKNSSSK